MLDIDCLLKNTDFIDGVRKYIKYIGNAHAEEGQDASFHSVYKRLRKEGLEVDIETAGQLYLSQLPADRDANFSTRQEVEEISGREFDETSRNLLLSPTKEGEQQIGDLSPSKAIATRIANAFNSDYIVDNSTRSILRGIQDMYIKTMDRMAPEGTPKPSESKKPFAEIFQEHLDRMKEGYRDNETGLVHNLSTLHEGLNKELKRLTDKLEAEGDPVKAEQWKKHVENFQDSVYDLALSGKEAKEGVEGALMAAGYERTNAKGEKVFDAAELARNTNSVDQLREKVLSALEKSGKFDKATADKIARSMQREYIDRVAKNVELADKSYNKKADSYTPSARQADVKMDDAIHDQVKEWQNYIGYKDRDGRPLVVSKKSAADALKHVMIEAGLSRQIGKSGELKVDIDKVSNEISSADDIKSIAKDYFSGMKKDDGTPLYDDATATHLSEAITAMAQDMFARVKEHVIGKQKAIEESWNPQPAGGKGKTSISDVVSKRLKEWSQYKKITKDINAPLRFTESEAKRIAGEVMKNSGDYGKEYANGDKAINWQAMADKPMTGDQMEALIQQHLTDNEGYSKSDAADAASSIRKDYYAKLQEDVKAHAQAMLDAKQKAVDRDAPDRKTAIHRLSELSSLGIFEKENEKLLFHVLGVDHANEEDLRDLKKIAATITELRNESVGRDYTNSFAYQSADKIASQLINRNKDDKSRLLKITRLIKNAYGLMNMTLIAGPFNLVENNWSGAQSIMGAKGELYKQMGADARLFSNRKLWYAVFKDAAIGGVDYGGAGDKWAHLGSGIDNLNSLNFKKNPVKATLTTLMLPFRAFLNGSDAANKAINHHYNMLLMMHKGLTENGWSNDEATHFLHESLYGDSFEKAKDQAYELIDKYGDRLGIGQSKYSRERAAIRWANDIVKANLNIGAETANWHNEKPVTNDLIEAALNSGFHAAAISMGHEANNRFSKMLHAGKVDAMKEERDLIERGKYSTAAAKRLWNTVYYDGVMRMLGGGANWAVLRAESLGLGLSSGFGGSIKSDVTKSGKEVFTNKEDIQQAMQDRLAASRQMTRALTGLSMSALAVGATALYGLLNDEDKEDGYIAAGFEGIKNSYVLNRLMTKAGPDAAFLYYLYKTSNGESNIAGLHAVGKYVENLLGSNPQFTVGGHIDQIVKSTAKGTDKGSQKAWGELGKLTGDLVGLGVPIYKPYKQIYQLAGHYAAGKEIENKFTKPKTVAQGMLMGGLLQDLINSAPEGWAENHNLEDWIYKSGKEAKKSRRY